MPQKDNAGLREKLALRREALAELGENPLVMELYAGTGQIGARLYEAPGVAIEKDEVKAAVLARRRPAWRVYEADAVKVVELGLARDLSVNFFDIDPYGDPWPAVAAVLSRGDALPRRFVLAVNDGLRRGVKMGVSWRYKSLAAAVRKFGADLHDEYLAVARWLLARRAGEADLRLARFRGFYGGHARQMTHYYALLEKGPRLL